MIDRLRQAMSAAGYDLGATELLDVLWLSRAMEGRTAAGTPGDTGESGDSVERVGGTGSASGAGAEGADGGGGGGWTGGAGGAEEAAEVEAAGLDASEVSGAADVGADGADAAGLDGPVGPGESSGSGGPSRRTGARADAAGPTDRTGPAAGSTAPAAPDGGPRSEPCDPLTPAVPPRRALYAMGSQGGEAGAERARPARVPGGRALPDAQQLGRALRPLRRSRDHPHRTVTDIEATVRLAAETGFLDVVARPEQERCRSAVLLVDCSPSMQVWGPLAAELRALLARSTVFRSVHVLPVDPQNPSGPAGRRRSAGAAVTFLLTDGTSPGWRSPQAVRALAAWGRRGPLAVLNPLPRRLWRGTALDARPRLLAAPGEFDPLGRLIVCDALSGERDPEADGLLALPVLHPTASALEQWAGLLTRPGVPHLIETALLDEAPPACAGPAVPQGTAEELLSHFRGAFSPEAYRLAVRLSAIRPLTTPLMQLVRAATMRDAGPTHVAEILLGGLLERTDQARDAAAARTLDRALGAPAPGHLVQPVYDFRPGVRELLFSGLGAEEAVEVVEAVGRSLEPYMGRLPDFPVLMGDEEGELRLQASARAFAVLASPVLERMGGVVPELTDHPVPAQRRAVPMPPRFGVLGPVRAWRGATPLALGGPEEQALLAALLLRPGHSAAATELIPDLWGASPPRNALSSLYACASRLNVALGADSGAGTGADPGADPGPDLLVREQGGGYALRRPDGSAPVLDLDLDRAEQLIDRARRAEDPAVARQLRDEALALWDGESLAGLPGPFAAAQRARLERWRGDLMDGHHRPLAEEPAPDPAGPRADAVALPPAPEPFAGRAEHLSRLAAGLTGGTSDAPPCRFLHGPAGAGKTALALRVAHEVADHFPDGQLFLDLRGSAAEAEDRVTATGALEALLRALGVPADRIPPWRDGRAALYRSLLAERRVLVVLDDAADADASDADASEAVVLAPLLPGRTGKPGGRGGAVLATGRGRPPLPPLAEAVELAALTPAEAQELFTDPGPPTLRWLDAQLSPPARRAFRLLAVAGTADASSAALSSGAATALLDATAQRTGALLDELLSVGALRKVGTDHYRYTGQLRRLACRSAVQELPDAARDAALARLLTWYLAMGRQVHALRCSGDRMLHDLVRVPSTGPLPSAKDHPQAVAAWADETPHLLAVVRRAAIRTPGIVRQAADLLLLAQVTADSGALSAAYEPAARTVAARAARDGDERAEGRARVALAEAYLTLGKCAEAEPEARRAEQLADRAGDPLTRFRASYARGIIALYHRRYDAAERHLIAAWKRCTERDELGEAVALGALARLWAATGNSNEAVLFAERSVALHRRVGRDSPQLAHGRYALAEALSAAGRPAEALRELSQALPLFKEDRQRLWAGRTRCRMAEAMVALIRPGEAVIAAEDAAKRLLVPGGERWRADALTALGHAETALGRKRGAQAHWREALAVHEAFGAPEARELRALLRDKSASPTAGPRSPGVSRAADAARTGTALRDLTAAVRTLTDQLRLHTADEEPGLGPPGLPARLHHLDAIEVELTDTLADFAHTPRPPRADLRRLRTALESLTSPRSLHTPSAAIAEAASAVRELGRRIAP
ncbi:SAV_2336 N-terminal domain-related protein [Streptomyces platensis]|uniref:SAV_2336 N-terminal domain-related protein n=1 Tax=Streptomyces platensis TaxID=58346 RepID=UPI002E812617|nr:SAV_2336 N-terminal domain-related protein [Streptomyces platensis]WUB79679.1 SAV_2336 family protein [Streptomyces platensis]